MPAQQVSPSHHDQRPANRRGPNAQGGKGKNNTGRKPSLLMDERDPAAWLGFSLPPRSVPGSGGMAGPPRRSKRNDTWRGSVLTREKFVNASFRFVLKPNEMLTYGAHFADPDISLHWPNVLQILVPTFSSYSVAQGFVSSEAEDGATAEESAEHRRRVEEEKQGRSCPICLSKPVAGRMTKCGHIFCFPCILHYIQLSDVPKSATCPICGDTIHEGMLKSVRYLDAETMVKAAQGMDGGVAGEDMAKMMSEAKTIDSEPESAGRAHRIHMRLLQRPQMTSLALPPGPTWPSDAIPPLTAPWYFLPDVITFCHFMLATPKYMLAQLQRELEELKGEWDLLAGDELGRSFVTAARGKVERQMLKVQSELVTPLVERTELEIREAWTDALGGERREREKQQERDRQAKEREERVKDAALDPSEVPTEFLDTTGYPYAGPTVHVPPNVPVAPNPMPPTTGKRNKRRPAGSIAPPTPPAPTYYFYQSSLGANVYLNPLDSRILLAEFHSYALFPPSISITTTGYDSSTITEDLRKRIKYLAHLPVGTEVVFVEADLTGIVSKETLDQFEQPLKARRLKRRDRTKRENRDARRIEQAERAKLPPDVLTLSSAQAGVPTDHELAMALARSLEVGSPENGNAFPLPGTAGLPAPAPTSTPSAPAPTNSSFAWAVNNPRGPRPVRVDNPDYDEAWGNAFNTADNAAEDETAPTKKKKGGKKAGKKLVLGGAGRQA